MSDSRAGADVRVLPFRMDGAAPLFPRLVRRDEVDATAGLLGGEVEVDEDALFVLDSSPAAPSTSAPAGILTVPPLPEVGSSALATAVTQQDLPSVLEALAWDLALVPVRVVDGAVRPVALASPDDDGLVLPVFSSAQAVSHSVLRDEFFVARLGAALVDTAATHREELRTLLIDEGSPASFSLKVAFLAAVLDDFAQEASDEDVEANGLGDLPSFEGATSLDLNLPEHWAHLDLSASDDRLKARIREVVKAQTRTLSDAGALLRQDMRSWLLRAAIQARAADGRDFAVLLARSSQAATALSVVNYWHAAPPGLRTGLLEAITNQVVEAKESSDELVLIDRPGDRVLRRLRHSRGASELGAQEMPLLLVDYWLPTPDDTAVAHVAFSTPHVELADPILALSDAIVLSATWARKDPPSAGAEDVFEMNPTTAEVV